MTSAAGAGTKWRIMPATAQAFAEVLATLHAACFDDAWSAQAFANLLRTPGTDALLAVDEYPAGFVIVRTAGGEAEILSLGVVPGARRLGLGNRLVEAAIGRARSEGAQTLFLEVAADNKAAHALYAASGFNAVGRRHGYYRRADGATADALVLSRSLDL